MVLTQRLLKIAELVSCNTTADIGTDHAKLPVYLIENGICGKVIASDVAEGPVKACKKTVEQSKMSEFVDIRKGNGLNTLSPKEVETIIIAGMGGDLISEILFDGEEVATSAKEIILQPMTHIFQLRKFLKEHKYRVIDEVLVKEKSKIYTIIKVAKGENQYETEFDFLVSPIFVQNQDSLLADYIVKLINKYKRELIGLNISPNIHLKQIESIEEILYKLEKLYEVAKNYRDN